MITRTLTLVATLALAACATTASPVTTRLGAFDVSGRPIDFAGMVEGVDWAGYEVYVDVGTVRYAVTLDPEHQTVLAIQVLTPGPTTAAGLHVGLQATKLAATLGDLSCRAVPDPAASVTWLGCTSARDPRITYLLDGFELTDAPAEAPGRLSAMPWVWIKGLLWDGAPVPARNAPPIPPLPADALDECARILVVTSACKLDRKIGWKPSDAVTPLDRAQATATCAAARIVPELPVYGPSAEGLEAAAQQSCAWLQEVIVAWEADHPRLPSQL